VAPPLQRCVIADLGGTAVLDAVWMMWSGYSGVDYIGGHSIVEVMNSRDSGIPLSRASPLGPAMFSAVRQQEVIRWQIVERLSWRSMTIREMATICQVA
jgi:hypothetical protein